jgi:hypothetical protein
VGCDLAPVAALPEDPLRDARVACQVRELLTVDARADDGQGRLRWWVRECADRSLEALRRLEASYGEERPAPRTLVRRCGGEVDRVDPGRTTFARAGLTFATVRPCGA